MAFKNVGAASFHGLRLDVDPLELGWDAARDGWNFDLSLDGLLKPRLGFERRGSITVAGGLMDDPALIYALPNSNRILVSDSLSGAISVYDSSHVIVGAANTTGTATATGVVTAVDANDGTYVANGSGARFVNSSGVISAPAFTGHTPIGEHLAVTPLDGRLVVNDGDDRVRFSNAQTPQTFSTDDWLDFNPGDGERIRAIVTWREFVFIFKQTNAWVYYGTSTDNTGGAVFETRPIASIPEVFPGGMPVAVGRDGVYYLGRGGVYVTTGSTPRKISTALDPIFSSLNTEQSVNSPNPGKPDYTVPSKPFLYWADDRLYVAYGSEDSFSANDRIAVWDQRLDEWMIWRRDTSAGADLTGISSITTQPIGSASGLNPDILIVLPRYTPGAIQPPTLPGVASMTDTAAMESVAFDFAWSYKSGYSDFNAPGEKVYRRTDIYGTGDLWFNMLSMSPRGSVGNTNDPVDIPEHLSLGLSAVWRTPRPKSLRGRLFAFEVNGSAEDRGIVNRLDGYYTGPTRSP